LSHRIIVGREHGNFFTLLLHRLQRVGGNAFNLFANRHGSLLKALRTLPRTSTSTVHPEKSAARTFDVVSTTASQYFRIMALPYGFVGTKAWQNYEKPLSGHLQRFGYL